MREWRPSRTRVALTPVAGFVFLVGGFWITNRAESFAARPSMATLDPMMFALLLFPAAFQTTRHAWIHGSVIATWLAFFIFVSAGGSVHLSPLHFRLFGSLTTVMALHILWLAWHRQRHPLFLRLTSTGVERGGYLRATPPIPYTAILRVDGVPFKTSPRVGMTLKEGRDWKPDWLRRLQGYDLMIGEDVGADAEELLGRIRNRLPETTPEGSLASRQSHPI